MYPNTTPEQYAQQAVAQLWALAIDQEASGMYEEGEHGYNAVQYIAAEAQGGDELRCKVEELIDVRDELLEQVYLLAQQLAARLASMLAVLEQPL